MIMFKQKMKIIIKNLNFKEVPILKVLKVLHKNKKTNIKVINSWINNIVIRKIKKNLKINNLFQK